MGIYIPNMEMPKENEILVFDMWHGKVYARSTANIGTRSYEVVPLPEGHGRLIDADALIRDKSGEATLWCGYEYQDHSVVFEEDIKNAPTIVPAEGGGEDG